MRLTISFILVLIALFGNGFGVDPSTYKKCEQSSFCRRCRKVEPGNSKFAFLPDSVNVYPDSITGELINKDTQHEYVLKLEGLEGFTFRLLIDEKSPLRPRYKVEYVLKDSPKLKNIKVGRQNDSELTVILGPNKAVIVADPFRVDFYQNDLLTMSVNAKGLMNFEHLRVKPQPIPGEDDDGAWEEDFNSFHDSKPYGPEAIALDFSFPEADVLFGIPEHADSFALKSTSNTDPYRLYNLDVVNYEVDSKMTLYGSVPVLYGHGTERTAGVFWHNSAETWVDIYNEQDNSISSALNVNFGTRKSSPAAHFMSESGIIDAFILLGPTPIDAFKQYTSLTGTANLPQLFALGYHQCRWNYDDEEDVTTVSTKFNEYDIPMDTMWLDIEYTDEKKYFTWDDSKFPDPLRMIKNLTDLGRHLVVIIDPHVKRDTEYFFHKECTDRGYYIKTPDGEDYEGLCWPGESSYVDFFNPEAREYYADQYRLENFNTITADVMIWNDMNEPAVFESVEKTMQKDLIHYGEWEHRDVHNLYGLLHTMGTFDGLIKRDPTQRPFILTRSHFAGTQRYAAVWTGDNTADWGHLQQSIKMCLAEAVAGISFCGADVGGFFGNPEPELFERWYQCGAFLPFFRSHANQDSDRREPWLFPEKTQNVIRAAIRKRYSYLPLWYTAFFEHERDGSPVIRPLLAHYPKDKETFNIDNSFLIQDRLLVRPVMQQGVTKVDVYFPSIDGGNNGDIWYDVDTFENYNEPGYVSIPVDEFKIPVYQRGGTIIPIKETVRQTSTLMKNDPYTLVICVDRQNTAEGTLYFDDEKSFKYREGDYVYMNTSFSDNQLVNKFIGQPKYKALRARIERVVIAGLERIPKSATVKAVGVTRKLLNISPYKNAIVINKLSINMLSDFHVNFDF